MKFIELDKAVLQILDIEIGYNINKIFEKHKEFMERQEKMIKHQIETTGKIDYSQWSTVCFDKLYNAVDNYRKEKLLPREDLIEVASNFVMKNTKITNPKVARMYVLEQHDKYVEKVWKKLEEYKQSGEAVAVQTGKCYFEERENEMVDNGLYALFGNPNEN